MKQSVDKNTTDQQLAGGKKVYNGPKGGKYIYVMCDGNRKKKYLTKSQYQTI